MDSCLPLKEVIICICRVSIEVAEVLNMVFCLGSAQLFVANTR